MKHQVVTERLEILSLLFSFILCYSLFTFLLKINNQNTDFHPADVTANDHQFKKLLLCRLNSLMKEVYSQLYGQSKNAATSLQASYQIKWLQSNTSLNLYLKGNMPIIYVRENLLFLNKKRLVKTWRS